MAEKKTSKDEMIKFLEVFKSCIKSPVIFFDPFPGVTMNGNSPNIKIYTFISETLREITQLVQMR